MRTGDLLGDLGKGRIARPSVFETVVCHRDNMSAAVPFANQTRARLQAKARRRGDPPRCPQGFRHRLQLAPRRLAESAVLDFLKPVPSASTRRSRLMRGASLSYMRRHSRRSSKRPSERMRSSSRSIARAFMATMASQQVVSECLDSTWI